MYYIYALRKKEYSGYSDYYLENVIYVGQTKNIKRRINQHKEKNFDDYIVLYECETLKEAKELENKYIKHYDPKLNKSLNFHGNYGTLKEHFESLSKHNINFTNDDLYEIMDIALNNDLKPLFSNKYSYFQFYEIIKKWNNYKQFGGKFDGK